MEVYFSTIGGCGGDVIIIAQFSGMNMLFSHI
jgi:hypothetical protein